MNRSKFDQELARREGGKVEQNIAQLGEARKHIFQMIRELTGGGIDLNQIVMLADDDCFLVGEDNPDTGA